MGLLVGWEKMQEGAKEASSYLERWKNDEGRFVVRLRSDAPDWVRTLLRNCTKCEPDDEWGLWAADCCLEAIIGSTHYKDVLVDSVCASDEYAGDPLKWIGGNAERRRLVEEEASRCAISVDEAAIRVLESVLMEIAEAFMASL